MRRINGGARLVPSWVRAFTLVIALLNIGFGAAGYFTISVLFPVLAGTNLSPDSPLLRHASWEFSARNLAIGLALAIVSLVGVPEPIAIVTIIRALTELQTIGITLMSGSASVAALAFPMTLLSIEIAIIRTVIVILKRRDAAAES